MGFAGRGNENDRYRMVAEHGNGLCMGRRESKRQNDNCRTGMVAEHGMSRIGNGGRTRTGRLLLQP
jgi:hypothetical protein